MKRIFLLLSVVILGFIGCHDVTVGYLVTENASYDPDTLVIRKTPDPKLDRIRIQYNSPWVNTKIQGYEGTQQINFAIESVTSTAGEEAAKVFMDELLIFGAGVMNYPLENNAEPGRYTVSIRIFNRGYSQIVEDAFTFIVVE